MPPDAAPLLRMSASEYLEWEKKQSSRHEYHEGQVFAMAGGSPRHNFLAIAVGAELRAGLRDRPCHVLSSDQRIAADAGTRYVCADAVAVCGGLRPETFAGDVLASPSVIVEVLSPGTENYDRGEKWQAYQRLASLSDYVLLSQDNVRVEHFQREPDGTWRYRVIGAGARLTLRDGSSFAVDDVYRGAFELEAG
jgi:Uma2 family endonuclease